MDDSKSHQRWLYVGKFEPAFYAEDSAASPEPTGSTEFVVKLADWERMTASLLSQVVKATGSIRAASKATGMPRSTLAGTVQRLRASGVWPE
jgi:transcriptional regulator of acetoin/glycerol metabolism